MQKMPHDAYCVFAVELGPSVNELVEFCAKTEEHLRTKTMLLQLGQGFLNSIAKQVCNIDTYHDSYIYIYNLSSKHAGYTF